MAAPSTSPHSDPPSDPSKIQGGEFTVPARSNGSAHAHLDNGDVASTSNPASSPGRHSPDKGQVPVPSDQPSPSNPNADTSSSPLVAPDSQPRVVSKDAQNSADGEKTEDTSTTPTLTHRGTAQSRRKANGSSNSDPAPTRANGNGEPKSSPTAKNSKPSFFSKLVHLFVPCLSSKSHSIEIDTPISPPATSERSHPVKPFPEKPGSAAPEPASQTLKRESPDLKDAQEAVLDETGLTQTPAPPSHAQISDDSDVIVPPTPTKTLPIEETYGVLSGALVPPGSAGTLHEKHSRASTVPSNASTDGDESDSFTDDDIDDMVDDDPDELILLNGGAGIPIGPDGVPKPLLPPIAPQHVGRKCLILDLDETLVHSSFKSIQQADYVVPVEIEYHWHNVYVIKRPGVDNFLKKMGEIYEIVVFTASLSKYADPVLDKLDVHKVVTHRLFRESCYNHRGNYVKDLSQLGRPIADTIILDNSPASYIFHPNNAVPVSSWFNDPHDTELTDLVPFLADLSSVDDVRGVLDGAR